MAKKVNKTDEQFANVEENLSKAGLYIVKNQSKIMKIVGSIILVITIIIGYNTLYIRDKVIVSSTDLCFQEIR